MNTKLLALLILACSFSCSASHGSSNADNGGPATGGSGSGGTVRPGSGGAGADGSSLSGAAGGGGGSGGGDAVKAGSGGSESGGANGADSGAGGAIGSNGGDHLKPRLIVLTDIDPADSFYEPDDQESMVRTLAYADQFEIEGLIASGGYNSGGWANGVYPPEWIQYISTKIDAYEKDLPNLLKRSNQTGFLADESKQEIGYWPSPAYLRARTMLGSPKQGVAVLGDTNDSAGSKLLITLADEDDRRPIWITLWGGGNTAAQAIWRVKKDRTPDQLQAFLHKLRIYAITDQDKQPWTSPYTASSHYWMRNEFGKDLLFLWDETQHLIQANTGKAHWSDYQTNIQGHGSLGASYPTARYGVEGDTPGPLYVLPTGLHDPEDPTQCNWGGYFFWGLSPDAETSCYINNAVSQQVIPPQSCCTADPTCAKYGNYFYQTTFDDFASRMAWAKNGTGNRNPVAVVNGDSTLAVLTVKPQAGTAITLDASSSSDPDHDSLTFRWWTQPEAGTYKQTITVANANANRIIINVPADSAGKSFHVICEVTDNGTPNLKGYRRVVFYPTDSSGAH